MARLSITSKAEIMEEVGRGWLWKRCVIGMFLILHGPWGHRRLAQERPSDAITARGAMDIVTMRSDVQQHQDNRTASCDVPSQMMAGSVRMQQAGEDVLLWIKAVPGASRDQIAGAVGERLKVRVTAAAEVGKANRAIGALLAKTLALKPRQVTIESGQSSAEKVVRLSGVTMAQVRAAMEL